MMMCALMKLCIVIGRKRNEKIMDECGNFAYNKCCTRKPVLEKHSFSGPVRSWYSNFLVLLLVFNAKQLAPSFCFCFGEDHYVNYLVTGNVLLPCK